LGAFFIFGRATQVARFFVLNPSKTSNLSHLLGRRADSQLGAIREPRSPQS
jgi:hypothetical protein